MRFFSRIIALLTLLLLVALPILASQQGWGVRSEQDEMVIKQSGSYCPEYRRDYSGRCRTSHRSYFYGRSHSGGGPGSGK